MGQMATTISRQETGAPGGPPIKSRKKERRNTSGTIAMRPLLFPDDTQFWYETLRALGHTAYGGADIGEVVTTAQRITAGDYDSWYEQWAATAAPHRGRGTRPAGHRPPGQRAR